MAPRANWKGYLKLSLVSCPVALFPAASTSERIGFHLINRQTGHRLKQQYIDSVTGEIVEPPDRMKGYEISKGDYVPIEDDELKDVQIESTHTIEIENFVPRNAIDAVYFDNHYYIAPDDKVGEEAFSVIREAMRQRGVAGVARVALFGRERILFIEPRSKGLVATVLRYDYEVRDDKAYFSDISDVKISAEMLDLASHIIDMKKGAFDPSQFKDRYQDAVVDLIRAKRAGRPTPAPAPERPTGKVINLMDALKRSLATEKTGSNASGAEPARPSARRTKATDNKRGTAQARGSVRIKRKAS